MSLIASAAAIGSSVLSTALGAGIVGGVGTGALGLSAGAIGAAGSAIGGGVAGGALGAGLGAISAAAQGGDVGNGALMGGVTGLAGGGIAGGLSGAAGAGAAGAGGTTASNSSGLLSSGVADAAPAAQMSTIPGGAVLPANSVNAAISGAPSVVTPLSSAVVPAAPSIGGGLAIPTLDQVGTGLQVAGTASDMTKPSQAPVAPRPAVAPRAVNQIPYQKPIIRGMGRFGGM